MEGEGWQGSGISFFFHHLGKVPQMLMRFWSLWKWSFMDPTLGASDCPAGISLQHVYVPGHFTVFTLLGLKAKSWELLLSSDLTDVSQIKKNNHLFFAVLGLHCCTGFSLVMASGGYSLLWCAGLSFQWLLLFQSTALGCTAFSSCSMWAQ